MEKSFYTGKGIGVCIMDTGIYEHIDFVGRIWAFYDFLAFKRRPYDDNGHGTHVAGLVAGDGTASMGKYRGAAPGCGIIALKVLDRYGNGSQEDVLRAFRWIREYRQQYRIRVVNISVGTTCNSKKDHTGLLKSVEQLWDEGMVIVTAAGNLGPKPGSITAPGSSKKVITVGSSDLLEGRGAISGRGPTEECVCKPDIVAPGNKIMSCVPGKPFSYGVKSGTSMSTPLVTGAIACALEKDPALTNTDIKTMLMNSADDMGLPRNLQGWGRFNRRKFLKM
ncbi:S8 family peptidase [Blautia glucerasea]|uniref:S8 family peptidase n=1 Tax=Blautia glucerasea TaxID=536633 RepID=UPI001D02460D|nr:S8 family peptidase [Blautia glucerasea]MCB5386135.1 S8 family peptidase [Blautia glucerasea]MCB5420489.1 S8 family peptidase [Blautia luti]